MDLESKALSQSRRECLRAPPPPTLRNFKRGPAEAAQWVQAQRGTFETLRGRAMFERRPLET